MTVEYPVERCPECGSVYKIEYIGPPIDPHAHSKFSSFFTFIVSYISYHTSFLAKRLCGFCSGILYLSYHTPTYARNRRNNMKKKQSHIHLRKKQEKDIYFKSSPKRTELSTNLTQLAEGHQELEVPKTFAHYVRQEYRM